MEPKMKRAALAALLGGLLLQGCASFVMHDEARAKLSADTKKAYADAKVTSVLEADRQNLATLLAAEIEVVQENARFQADWASLELANGVRPMGVTVAVGAMKQIAELGFHSVAELRPLGDAGIDRAKLLVQIDRDRGLLGRLKFEIPDCNEALPPTPTVPAEMSASDANDLQRRYASYVKHCTGLLAVDAIGPSGGDLGNARQKWLAARKAQAVADKAYKAEQAKLKQAKKEYDDAVKEGADAAKAGPELTKKIAEKAEKLGKAVEDAKKLDKGLEHEPLVDTLVDLLTAAAGGDVNPSDPSMKGPIAVAKQIPSLAGDIKALEAERKTPPVSGLLIALRHQALLAELARQRALLQAERVGIYKAAYDTYLKASAKWQAFFDAICSYAVLGARMPPPGEACDTAFVLAKLDQDGKPIADDSDPARKVVGVRCDYKGKKIDGCLLEQPWKDRLRGAEDCGRKDCSQVKRQLYAAVAAYLQALELQERPLEQRFREIDVAHRETLLAKKSAIDQWDNLVGVPLEQLEAYYKAGVKPAELADLIVKALGFTAIAIGVSK